MHIRRFRLFLQNRKKQVREVFRTKCEKPKVPSQKVLFLRSRKSETLTMDASNEKWLLACMGCACVVVAILFYVLVYKKRREMYGGPVKNIKYIPQGDCFKLCRQYYEGCMRDTGDVDASWCISKEKACRSTCVYSSHQRL